MSISDNLEKIKSNIPTNCRLVAVSKTKPKEDILEAYAQGHLDFGENKVQEMIKKSEELPVDIHWHFIGHLQRNKVKYIAPFVHLIHGVDSERLLLEINKQGEKTNRRINCLLQIHIASEETKFGLTPEEAKNLLANQVDNLPYVSIQGLMGMATHTIDSTKVTEEFGVLKHLFDELALNNCEMKILSMGMSNDYPLALKEGSNMVRIGSAIFGTRNHN